MITEYDPILELTCIYTDDWGRLTFKDINNKIWKKVDGWYYSCTKDGEPDCPLKKEYKVVISDEEI